MEEDKKIKESEVSGNKNKEPEIPPSPKTKVSLRTMETDKSSLAKNGGEPPKPILVELELEPQEGETKGESQDQKGKEEKSPEPLIKENSHKNLIIGVSIFVVGVIIFFFFVYAMPLMTFKSSSTNNNLSQSNPNSKKLPPVKKNTSPSKPKEETSLPNKITIPKANISASSSIPQSESNSSKPSTGSGTIIIDQLTLSNIKSALKNRANDLKNGDLQIINFASPNGIIKVSDFLQVILKNPPQKEEIERIFVDKFSGFLYKENNKPYIGYVFTFKPDIIKIQAQSLINPFLEDKDRSLLSNILWYDITKSDNLYHFYLDNNLIVSTYNINQDFIKKLVK